MKKLNYIIIFILVAAAIAGIVYYQSRQSASAPVGGNNALNGNGSQNGSENDLTPLETDPTLEAVKSQSGLAFSAAKNFSFLWFTAKDKTGTTVNGQVITVGAVSTDEVKAISQIMEKLGFKADENNNVSGYNAWLTGHINASTVCLIESGTNLINRGDNPSDSNPAGLGDIRLYCGKLENSGSANNLPGQGKIHDYKACSEAGYPVIAANPRQCVTLKEIFFEIKTCKARGGEILSIDEAIKIEEASVCAKEGSMKNDYYCDESAGAWRIGLQAARTGCDPVCVIDVALKTATIDWRCAEAKQ
jgi:hypothetical protein